MSSNEPTLVEPNVALRDAYLSLIDEYRSAGEEYHQGDRPLVETDFPAFVRRLQKQAVGEDLPPGFVPQTTYWLVRDGAILATSRLRHYLVPELEREGGNVGYDVRPSERRKGNGTLLLSLMLEKARALGLRRVLVTCDSDNVGSARVIQKNGGVFQDEVISRESGKPVSRYWIDL